MILGGVGIAAVQLARTRKDVTIYGTGSANKEDDALLQGVDVFFSNESLVNQIKHQKYDLILTNKAGPIYGLLQNQLNPLGRIILIGMSTSVNFDSVLNQLIS